MSRIHLYLTTIITFFALAFSPQFAVIAEQSDKQDLGSKPDPIAVAPAQNQVPEALVLLGSGEQFSRTAFVMDKANRTLTIWKQDKDSLSLIKSVPADFGRNGGDKSIAGDHRTPEGIYFFQEMKEGSGLNFDEYGVRAFTLDYPNYFDQKDKKSGSGIWLHAIPDTKSLLRGSRGCVVVRNQVIKEISPFISLRKTPIVIQDQVKYITVEEAVKLRSQWQNWLSQWRTSWQSKNIDSYIGFYSQEFKSMGMKLKEWKNYKQALNSKYSFIEVQTIEPMMIQHGDRFVIRFKQEYKSDLKSDSGEKTLYLQKSEGDFKILGEEWTPLVQNSGVVANY